MQQFCDKLVEVIGEAPTPEISARLSEILSDCKNAESGDAGDPPPSTPYPLSTSEEAPDMSAMDSGPTSPAPPPPPKRGF